VILDREMSYEESSSAFYQTSSGANELGEGESDLYYSRNI